MLNLISKLEKLVKLVLNTNLKFVFFGWSYFLNIKLRAKFFVLSPPLKFIANHLHSLIFIWGIVNKVIFRGM